MNYTVVEVVVDRLISRFKLRDWQYDIEDLVEDIAEALKLIGAAAVYENKVEMITFTSNMAPLPGDCQHVKFVHEKNFDYLEQGSFIVADVADGTELGLYYQAMPTDTRGFPSVPDNTTVREAIIWYMAKNLIFQGILKTVNIQYADQEWHWRCGSARAELNAQAMSVNSMSKVYNDFTRLNPLKDQHQKNYKDVGRPNTTNRDPARDFTNRR